MNTTLKAIFFDMDGVLVCSEETHFQAWKELLNFYKVQLSDEQFLSYIGTSDIAMAIEFSEKHGLLISPEELCGRKREVFLEMISQGFSFPEGRNEFLEQLHGHFQLAVVSSSSKREVNAILKAEKIHHYFDFMIANEDTPKHKPDPMPYLAALQKSNVKPWEAIVIEDSHVGISAAIQAELTVLGISSTFSSHPDFPFVRFYEDFHSLLRNKNFL